MFDGTNTNTNSITNGDRNSVKTCESSHSQRCVNQSPVFLVFFFIFDPVKSHSIPLIFADSDIKKMLVLSLLL